jgi:hypothetical protein
LRGYPPAWRARYGDELLAMVEEDLGGRRPTRRFRLSLVSAGLRERAHEAGMIGAGPSAAGPVRAGSLVILCAWAAFVLAGASFSKVAEHFARAVPVASRTLPQDAFTAVAALGVSAAVLVALGALIALPSFVRFVRAGGWPSVRGHVHRAIGLSVLMAAGLVPLSVWAHHLDTVQRNGGDAAYAAVIGAWSLVVAATLAQWTAAGVAAARRITFSPALLRLESLMAVIVAGAMLAITAATALWWAAMAHDAPWFLTGTASVGSHHPSPFDVQLVATLALMTVAVLTAAYGVYRIVRFRARLGVT